MLEQFNKFKKYKEYFSWEFENKFALLFSIIVLIICGIVNLYEDINQFVTTINDFGIALIGAYVGSLALIFSGVVFLGGLLNGHFERKLIKYSEDKDVTEKLYVSYLFLAFNILCMIVLTIVLILFIQSNLVKPPLFIFEITIFVYCYLTFFIMAYFVAIIRNTVDLLIISKNNDYQKSFYERANEVRVDMILQFLYKEATPEETKKYLSNYIKHYIDTLEDSEDMKNKLFAYFSEYYSFNGDKDEK